MRVITRPCSSLLIPHTSWHTSCIYSAFHALPSETTQQISWGEMSLQGAQRFGQVDRNVYCTIKIPVQLAHESMWRAYMHVHAYHSAEDRDIITAGSKTMGVIGHRYGLELTLTVTLPNFFLTQIICSTVCVRRARWHVAGATPGKKRYGNYLSCKTTNTVRILQLLNYELRSLNLEIHGPLVGRLVACHCGSRCNRNISRDL
jgi:hypothetical protein